MLSNSENAITQSFQVTSKQIHITKNYLVFANIHPPKHLNLIRKSTQSSSDIHSTHGHTTTTRDIFAFESIAFVEKPATTSSFDIVFNY